jgi:hypothetical protein
MRIKAIHVLDDATDVYYLVGKPDENDEAWMRWAGWGMGITLIVRPIGGGGAQAAISSFGGNMEYDLTDKGPVDVNSTSLGLVEAVRDLDFDDLPELVDLR